MRLRNRVLVAATAAVLICMTLSARAADVTVGCFTGDLFDAIAAAAGTSAASTITLAPGCDYVFSGDAATTAPDGSPTIFAPMTYGGDITIYGNGATIERDNATSPARFFYINSGTTLSLNWLTLKNGISRGDNGSDASLAGTPAPGGSYNGLGGAILVDSAGTLFADGVTFDGNQAIGGNGGKGAYGSSGGGGGGGLGGAIYTRGTVTITRSLFTANIARGGTSGGQLNCYSAFGSLCTNYAAGGGGGKGGTGGVSVGLTPTTSPTSGSFGGGGGGCPQNYTATGASGGFAGGGGGGTNPSGSGGGGPGGSFGGTGSPDCLNGGGGGGLGGAIFVHDGYPVSVRNSTFSANQAIGGNTLDPGGDGGSGAGGAIFVYTNPNVDVQFDTFMNNSSSGGDAVNNWGDAYSIVHGGNAYGGNAYFNATSTSIGHTIVSNGSVTAGTVTDPIAGSTSGTASSRDVYGGFTSLGYSFFSTKGYSNTYISSDQYASPGQVIDPLLGPLGNNRGPTLTFLPQNGSPVIDWDTTAGCADAVGGGDARGDARPFGSGCDIGAVEVDDEIFRSGMDPPFD